MIGDNELIEIIYDSELLLEGIDKYFWRLIKLSKPEIWKDLEDSDNEYVWVVAIMGNMCIFYDDTFQKFDIARYKLFGEIKDCQQNKRKLHNLITETARIWLKIS